MALLRWYVEVIFITTLIHLTAAKFIVHQKCLENNRACGSTDYRSYLGCVRNRQKRTIECKEDCENCQCDSCSYNQCQNSCQPCCSSCCSNYIPCTTHHCCHRTCHAQCDSSDCRLSCRKNCIKQVDEEQFLHFNHFNHFNSSSRNSVANNVTTVIHLNNVVNSTNVIDVPITLQSKNIQNVSLHEVQQQETQSKMETGEKESSGRGISVPVHEEGKIISGSVADNAGQKPCCIVVGPKQCTSNYPGYPPKCFHLRSKQCGDFCITNIVHREEHQVCESLYPGAPNNCRQQIVYIPQPQPRCTYQDDWPYVRCGLRRSPACSGCYSHYVNKDAKDYLTCPLQCFDEFPPNGPFYRQGPIYQPQYGFGTYNRDHYDPMMGGLLFRNPAPGMFYYPITSSNPVSSSPSTNWSVVYPEINVGQPTQLPLIPSDSYSSTFRKKRTDPSENSVNMNTEKASKSSS